MLGKRKRVLFNSVQRASGERLLEGALTVLSWALLGVRYRVRTLAERGC